MQDEELKQKIRDGSYYQEARKWYSVTYLSSISDRVFYIILSVVALLTMLFALTALMGLMPLAPSMPLFIHSNDVLRNLPRIIPLAKDGEESNTALRRFYVATYVKNRENYNKDKVNEYVRFIYNNSDRPTYEVFKRYYDTTNPRSPIVLFGAVAEREVSILNLDISLVKDANPAVYNATVYFDAVLTTYEQQETTRWRADLTFEYQDLVVEQDVNKTIETGLKITPMKFVVKSYTVSQLKAQ